MMQLRRIVTTFTVTAITIAAVTACSGPAKNTRPYPEPKLEAVVAKLAAARARLSSFNAESVMDYWLGKDRVKGTVLVMGTPGAKVRFNALSPAGDSPILDMACNGTDFTLVDIQNNCALSGPCNADSIAQLLRVPMAPDDFFYLAMGQTPVLSNGANVTGKITWDAGNGLEHVELSGAGGTQSIVIDARDDHWDIRKSQLNDTAGKLVWSVENTEFEEVADATGAKFRLPNKTRFQSPSEKADLLVEWQERTINPTLDASKFVLTAPAGLPMCGSAPKK
jgi:outer membrane lipoprotein-sorting protein